MSRGRRPKDDIPETGNDSEDGQQDSVQNTGGETDEDMKESAALIDNLKRNRRKKQRELARGLKPLDAAEDDVDEKMRTARMRTRDKIILESQKDESDRENLISPDSNRSIPTIEDEDERSPPSSSRVSARSPRSGLRDEGSGRTSSPRKLGGQLSVSKRLKDKIEAAKQKGKEKDEGTGDVVSARRLAGLRDRPRSTRFDDPTSKEEREAEEQLEKSLKKKWREASSKARKKGMMPTEEEAYDFFTLEYEEEKDEKKDAPEVAAEPEAGPSGGGEGSGTSPPEEGGDQTGAEGEIQPAEDVEAGADGAAEPKDGAADKDKKKDDKPDEKKEEESFEERSWKYYKICKAEYKGFHKQIEIENDIYFTPSMIAAPPEEKIFEQNNIRYLEDEGFYVGTKPNVSNRNLNRMENRLLKQPDQGREYFGEDGRLIFLPDPLKEVPSRPPIIEQVEPELETEYKKALVTEFDSRYIDGSLEGYGLYQLDIDINTVSFSHHHLFSQEHVLAVRLTQQYQHYVNRNRKKAADFLTEKMKALQNAAHHVQETLTNWQGKKSGNGYNNQQHRLKEYKYEIRQTRKQRDQEMQADRALLKNIMKTWKDIKNLREVNKYNNTSVKLQLKKEPTNKAEDEAEWQQDVEDELVEQQEDLKEEHKKIMKLYREQLDKWKKYKLELKEAKTRERERKTLARRTRTSPDDIDDATAEREDELEKLAAIDKEIIDSIPVEKPEKPIMPDDAEARERINNKYNEIRRKPGEPRLIPELSNGASVTPTTQCPRAEQSRRGQVNGYKVFVKVLYNDKEVGRTPAKPLGQDFVVVFAQIFNIQIVQWPESIKIQVYESSGITNTLLSETYAAIPDANVTTAMVQLDEIEFSSDQRISHNHEGVGSGVQFRFNTENIENTASLSMMTSGTLLASVAWAVDEVGNVLIPPIANASSNQYSALTGMDAVAAIGASGMADMDKLTKWITESRLDPNDPSNADLMYLVRPSGAAGDTMMISDLRAPDHFRLEQLQEEFNFTTDEEIERNKRFQLIKLREKEVPDFKNYKCIPLKEKEIPPDTFAEYEKKQREKEKLKATDGRDSHRAAVSKFMQMVREQVMERFRIASHQKQLSDMVYEDAVPNIGTIIPNIKRMTEPRRPLKPHRKERKAAKIQSLGEKDVKVLVNIVRAFDIPIRSTSQRDERPAAPPMGTGTSFRGQSPQQPTQPIAGESQVRPMVEVLFQRNVLATSVADGPNPCWNEELEIPFRAPNNDYSANKLQSVKDIIFINLFDECVHEVIQDDAEQGRSVQRRIEKRWLGNLKIPFSTVYFNSRIEGTFRINRPPVLLGYTHDTRGRTRDDAGGSFGEADKTYLSLFITIQPKLAPPEPVKEKFESNEEERLLNYADKWQTDLEKKFEKREYKTTVVDINGKAVFLTRYMKKLKPPDELLPEGMAQQESADLAARYVSMIPFVSDSVVFPGLCDIWSTCDQFMSMLQGDEEEHAVLLANYLLHFGKDAYLLLGSAIPEGPTAYVLTIEGHKDIWIWNASTAERFKYRDNYCPVQSVGCLVNHANIWANIQPYDQPSRMAFDLNNTKNWKPFFDGSFPNPGLSPVQPEALIYTPTDKHYVLDLSDKIERTLKEKVMGWRPQYITRWNRYCMQSFRSMLKELETSRGKGVQHDHSSQLETILGSYKICGFPINLPYTEMSVIIESVYATGVHNNDSSDVEFALAVHIHPYPNSVLSVWVYVASLVRKR